MGCTTCIAGRRPIYLVNYLGGELGLLGSEYLNLNQGGLELGSWGAGEFCDRGLWYRFGLLIIQCERDAVLSLDLGWYDGFYDHGLSLFFVIVTLISYDPT